MKPLVIVPTYLTEESDVGVVSDCIASVRRTVSDQVDILLVDDGSPEQQLVDAVESQNDRRKIELHRKSENEGFSRTVNVGLERALSEGRDAVLINADVEMSTPGWATRCQKTTGPDGRVKAAVVGGLLLFPNGLIQHAGVYFSLLTRTFDHMYKYGPGNLPEAMEKKVVPVTAAFQYIRHETLQRVGIYDPQFRMGWEDVDYCIRVFKENLLCVYNPNVRGYHFEQMFRGRKSEKIEQWTAQSFFYLCHKWSEQSFAGLVPFW